MSAPDAQSEALTAERIESRLRPHDASAAGRVRPAWSWRILVWLLLGVVVAAYAVAMLSPVHGAARFVLLEVIYCVPIAVTIGLSAIALLRSEGAERVFWAGLGTANTLLLACEVLLVVWVFAIDPSGPPRVSWPFHIMHAGAALAFLVLILSMTRVSEGGDLGRLRFYVDFGIGGLVAYVALLTLYARPLMTAAGAPIAHVLLGAAYPLTGALLLSGTLVNVLGLKVVKWRSWEKLVAFALPVYAIGVSMWPWWYTTAAEGSRNLARGWLDLVQMSGHWTLMMAVVYRLTEPAQWNLRPLPPLYGSRRRWMAAAAPLAALAALPAMGYAAYLSRSDGEWFLVYGVLTTLLALSVVSRGVLVALEQSSLFHLSVTDPLTGLYNHRFFHARLAEEVARARRWGDPVSLIMIDVDDFGMLNQRLGHSEGDRLLASLGTTLRHVCGENDVAARLGGDEFGVIVPEMDGRSATVFAQRVLDVLGIEGGFEPGQLSASAGVASYPDHAETPEDLVRVADGALFRAKELGKDRVVLYEPERVPDLSARERIQRLEVQSRLASVRALAAAVDARDSATQDHSVKVAGLARRLCEALGFDEEHASLVELAAMVHDVGKIGLADGPLLKPGPLSPEEWAQVREHPALGQRILAATQLSELLPWVRGHHERWDGEGYPDGLTAEEIPLEARVLSVCDAFDAMVSDRPYRRALSHERAMAELRAQSGSQFDPSLIEAFEGVFGLEDAG